VRVFTFIDIIKGIIPNIVIITSLKMKIIYQYRQKIFSNFWNPRCDEFKEENIRLGINKNIEELNHTE
jgi:hypothetical protein